MPDLNTNTFTGVIDEPKKGIKGFMHKIFKKCMDWYLFPWGIRQNELNTKLVEEIQALESKNSKIDELSKQIEVINHSIEENEKWKKEIIHYVGDNDNWKTEKDVMLASLDNSRQNAVNIQLKKYSIYNKKMSDMQIDKSVVSLNDEELAKIISKGQHDDGQEWLHQLHMNVEETIVNQGDTADKGNIFVVCENLNDARYSEANRKETFAIYKQLKRESEYDLKLVSLERGEGYNAIGDIIWLGEESADEFFAHQKVAAILFNCSSLVYANSARGVFKKYPSLFRITSQNPLQGVNMDSTALDSCFSLMHLNDYGFLNILVLSDRAKKVLEEAGFKNVSITSPVIEDEIKYKEHHYNKKRPLVVGMASSPMTEEEIEDRGMPLLGDIADQVDDIELILLWRNEKLDVPDYLKEKKDIILRYGMQDMETFYQEIDCLIIPFSSYDHNHACALSAIEAMLYGVPVISTEYAGVSDYVLKCGMGLVADQLSMDSFLNAFVKLKESYAEFCQRAKAEFLKMLILQGNLTSIIDSIAGNYHPQPIITLDDWRLMVEEKGKKLVIGQDEIKAYYSQFEVAEHYQETRFMQFPENCFDAWERGTISGILKKYIGRNSDARILDIAPGDGRILQEDIKYGICTAMDASAAMLNLVRERFSESDRIKTVEGDYFIDEIDDVFDVITTFRYIRHFSYKDRQRLYKKIRSNLKTDGILIFDVPNIRFECDQRNIHGWGNYNVYDVFWDEDGIVRELESFGFRVDGLIPVGKGVNGIEEPMTWTVVAVRD